MPRDPSAELRAVLAECRRAILTSRFDQLDQLGARCEALAAELQDPAAIEEVRDGLIRNQNLVVAALRGLAEGRRRLDQTRHAAAGFDSYDSTGEAGRIEGPAGRRLAHRA